MKVHLSPGTTLVEFVCPPPVFHSGCDFDDCTLDAVYCVGHALELAQVSDIEEAPKVRRALEGVLAAFEAASVPTADPLRRAEVGLLLARAMLEARDTLARFPQ